MTIETPLHFQLRARVPEGAFERDQPLVAVTRGQYVGSLHRGTIAVANPNGDVVLALGDVEQGVFLRSAAKPFQVMPAVLAGALNTFGITAAELAVLCASHNAEPRHTDAVLSVLAKVGLDESALHCGTHPPLHEPTAQDRWRRGVEPTPVCNNCSGAHTGMLVACRARGWSIENYGAPDHPLQTLTRGILAAFAGVSPADVGIAVDNCHVPAFRLPVRRAAQAFARLATGNGIATDLQSAAKTIVAAMTGNPEMVGGTGRFDTDLMRAAGGDIVAKSGAEGFQGVSLLRSRQGIAIKVSDGNGRAVSPAVMRLLAGLQPLDSAAEEALESYRAPVSLDLEGDIVGGLVPVFEIEDRA